MNRLTLPVVAILVASCVTAAAQLSQLQCDTPNGSMASSDSRWLADQCKAQGGQLKLYSHPITIGTLVAPIVHQCPAGSTPVMRAGDAGNHAFACATGFVEPVKP